MTIRPDIASGRRDRIVRETSKRGKVFSDELRKIMGVSEKTIRDDLKLLVEQERLSRGYFCSDWDMETLDEKVYYFATRPEIQIGVLKTDMNSLPIYVA